MILHEFPNLQWLKQQAEQRFAARKSWTGAALQHGGWPTVILNVATRQTYRDNVRGPLSLFTNLSGESSVKVGSRQAQIREGLFFPTTITTIRWRRVCGNNREQVTLL